MQRLASRLARISLHPSDVATACRDAGMAFLHTRRWSKRELAEWLVESYQFATLRGHGGGVAPKHHGTVSRETVVDLVERVREEVRNVLDHVLTGDASFAEELVRSGAVAPLKLEGNKVLYVAMNHKSLRLADRVLSLFAADFLMRPRDYRARLSVCETCRAVSFSGECRHPQSGIFLKDGREIPQEITCAVEIDEAMEEAMEETAAYSNLMERVEAMDDLGDGYDDEEATEIDAADIIVLEALAS